jgi:hypothetical protein
MKEDKIFNMNEFTQYCMNYIKQNPIKSITSFSLIVGGIFLLIYFFHVGYFPTSMRLDDIFLLLLLCCFKFLFYISIYKVYF